MLELVIKIRDIVKEYYNIDLSSCLTNASIARNYFLQNHDFENYPLHIIPIDDYRRLKPYYLGGRNEVYQLGSSDEMSYYYDFTSLYPSKMKIHDIPYGKYNKIIIRHRPDIKETDWDPSWFGVAIIKIKSNSTDFMPFYGIKKDGKLLFKHFKDYTEIMTTTPHINEAKRLGLDYSYKVVEIWNYNKYDNFFEPIVDGCYVLKTKAEQDGNEPLRQMSKIIINSLYGFWGIRFDGIETMAVKQFKTNNAKVHNISKHLNRDRLLDYKDVGNSTIIYTREELDIKCANIIIAMFITDYARQGYYNLANDIQKIGGKLIYGDTDSIITNLKLEDTPLNEKYRIKVKSEKPQLGDLTNEFKIRGGGYKSRHILGCKSYCLVADGEDYPEDLEKMPEGKYKTELKFKGFKMKQTYDEKIIDHEAKTITFKGINNINGRYGVTPNDYILMNKGYKMRSDNFSFITSVKTLGTINNIIYIENTKVATKQYHKATIEDNGDCTPFYD